MPLLFKVLDADWQGVLAPDEGRLLGGEIRGSLYEFKAVSEQDVQRDPVEYIRLRRTWSDLESRREATGGLSADELLPDPGDGLWASSRTTAEAIRSARGQKGPPPEPPAEPLEAVPTNTAESEPNQHASNTADTWYILFRAGTSAWIPALVVDDFTAKEVSLLIQLLDEELWADDFATYQFKSVAQSELAKEPAKLIRLRRLFSDIEPYFGEFDFGVWDFRFPEEWKKCVHVNYAAAGYADEIRAMRAESRQEAGATPMRLRKLRNPKGKPSIARFLP